MRKKAVLCLMAIIVAISFMPATAFAATKSMTVYDSVLKVGSNVIAAPVKVCTKSSSGTDGRSQKN